MPGRFRLMDGKQILPSWNSQASRHRALQTAPHAQTAHQCSVAPVEHRRQQFQEQSVTVNREEQSGTLENVKTLYFCTSQWPVYVTLLTSVRHTTDQCTSHYWPVYVTVLTSVRYSTDQCTLQYWPVYVTVLTSVCYSTDQCMLQYWPVYVTVQTSVLQYRPVYVTVLTSVLQYWPVCYSTDQCVTVLTGVRYSTDRCVLQYWPVYLHPWRHIWWTAWVSSSVAWWRSHQGQAALAMTSWYCHGCRGHLL